MYQPFASGARLAAAATPGAVESYWSANVPPRVLPATSVQIPVTEAVAESGPEYAPPVQLPIPETSSVAANPTPTQLVVPPVPVRPARRGPDRNRGRRLVDFDRDDRARDRAPREDGRALPGSRPSGADQLGGTAGGHVDEVGQVDRPPDRDVARVPAVRACGTRQREADREPRAPGAPFARITLTRTSTQIGKHNRRSDDPARAATRAPPRYLLILNVLEPRTRPYVGRSSVPRAPQTYPHR